MPPLQELLAASVLFLAGGTLLLLVPFALHRSYLLLLSRRSPPRLATRWDRSWPRVTVQLPIYNEPAVVERLIDAACSLDYPRERLDIQVLDDSTDETVDLAARRIREWRCQGVDIRHIRRRDRSGYKAGALAHGLGQARGEFLLILDADFLPPPDLLYQLLPPFLDPEIGMVQARWDHLNESESLLTRAQAYLLDGHFFFEHYGRFAGGRFFNFNGTAGMWRRRCLEDAGGWQSDTLTEDLDLSYRAQMRGWRFAYLGEVGVPAELPSGVGPLEVQQRRWAQGGIQTARKLLPRLLAGPYPLRVKTEAVFHLCGHLAHPLTLVLGVLILPSAVARETLGLERLLGLDLLVFAAATLPFLVFYGAAGRRRGRPWRSVLPTLPVVLATGIGLTASVSGAVLRGLRVGSAADPFLRTPKKGEVRSGSGGGAGVGSGLRVGSRVGHAVLKLALSAWMLGSLVVAVRMGFFGSIPFIVLFGSGWLMLGIKGIVVSSVGGEGTPGEGAPTGKAGWVPSSRTSSPGGARKAAASVADPEAGEVA